MLEKIRVVFPFFWGCNRSVKKNFYIQIMNIKKKLTKKDSEKSLELALTYHKFLMIFIQIRLIWILFKLSLVMTTALNFFPHVYVTSYNKLELKLQFD